MAWAVIGLPIWAVLSNALTNVEQAPSMAELERAQLRLAPIGFSAGLALNLGPIWVAYSYLAAGLSRKKPSESEDRPRGRTP